MTPSQMRGIPLPGLGLSGPKTILSVWPRPLSLELRHKGTTFYAMEGAPKGEYRTLTVEDTYATCRNFSNGQYYAAPVPSDIVAENLVHSWTRGLVGTKEGLGPGIILCEKVEPSDAEVERAMAHQAEYFRYLIQEADAAEMRGDPAIITDTHRMAAEWMGTKDRTWAKPTERVDLKACPACAEPIRAQARVCRWCQKDLAKFEQEEANRQLREANKALRETDKPSA